MAKAKIKKNGEVKLTLTMEEARVLAAVAGMAPGTAKNNSEIKLGDVYDALCDIEVNGYEFTIRLDKYNAIRFD